MMARRKDKLRRMREELRKRSKMGNKSHKNLTLFLKTCVRGAIKCDDRADGSAEDILGSKKGKLEVLGTCVTTNGFERNLFRQEVVHQHAEGHPIAPTTRKVVHLQVLERRERRC